MFGMPNICKRPSPQVSESSSAEDYLEAILVLSEDFGSSVRVTDLSERLGVSKPSVSVAVKRLADAGYVTHERYGDVKLTSTGRRRASEVAAKHDLLFRFLAEVLGVSEETAQIDACRLEHDLSEETVHQLMQFVDFLTGSGEGNRPWNRRFEAYLAEGKHHADLIGEG
jgi:DtxR family Mn-dependent transcriptional regulator